MRIADFVLLAKKIAVGIVITVLPLGILIGPLWITQHKVKKAQVSAVAHATEAPHAN